VRVKAGRRWREEKKGGKKQRAQRMRAGRFWKQKKKKNNKRGVVKIGGIGTNPSSHGVKHKQARVRKNKGSPCQTREKPPIHHKKKKEHNRAKLKGPFRLNQRRTSRRASPKTRRLSNREGGACTDVQPNINEPWTGAEPTASEKTKKQGNPPNQKGGVRPLT